MANENLLDIEVTWDDTTLVSDGSAAASEKARARLLSQQVAIEAALAALDSGSRSWSVSLEGGSK